MPTKMMSMRMKVAINQRVMVASLKKAQPVRHVAGKRQSVRVAGHAHTAIDIVSG